MRRPTCGTRKAFPHSRGVPGQPDVYQCAEGHYYAVSPGIEPYEVEPGLDPDDRGVTQMQRRLLARHIRIRQYENHQVCLHEIGTINHMPLTCGRLGENDRCPEHSRREPACARLLPPEAASTD